MANKYNLKRTPEENLRDPKEIKKAVEYVFELEYGAFAPNRSSEWITLANIVFCKIAHIATNLSSNEIGAVVNLSDSLVRSNYSSRHDNNMFANKAYMRLYSMCLDRLDIAHDINVRYMEKGHILDKCFEVYDIDVPRLVGTIVGDMENRKDFRSLVAGALMHYGLLHNHEICEYLKISRINLVEYVIPHHYDRLVDADYKKYWEDLESKLEWSTLAEH